MKPSTTMRQFALAALCISILGGCNPRLASVTFTPAALKDCGTSSTAGVVEVHWDATRAKPEDGVKLWIDGKGKPRYTGFVPSPPGKLWRKGGSIGSATTGPWMFAGTTVVVTDAKTERVLAKVKVPAAPCQ